jgi:hypothetical protein
VVNLIRGKENTMLKLIMRTTPATDAQNCSRRVSGWIGPDAFNA